MMRRSPTAHLRSIARQLKDAEKVPATVERARALRASGLTLKQITDQMTAEGFKTNTGSPYQMGAIGRMIVGAVEVSAKPA